MQVKKFEAPTLQEALDTIKRELGPEAIILQTKQNRRGFGLMSKGSVEVTAAVSGRALEKKTTVERRLPEAYTQKVNGLAAHQQADIYESYLEKRIEKENVQLSSANQQANTQKKRTAVRYADIADDESAALKSDADTLPQYTVPKRIETAMENYSNLKSDGAAFREEIENLKRLVEELRATIVRDRNKPDYLDSNSPFTATDALQESYEILLQSGIEKRFAVQIMREIARDLSVEQRAERDAVLDSIADRLLKQTEVKSFFDGANGQVQTIHAFVGASGVGKTSILAKLATNSARIRGERMGVIRIQAFNDESVDSLSVFTKALHVPYRVVMSSEELLVAVQDMSQCNRIFIDTPSVPAKDQNSIVRIGNILASVPQIKVHLVLSCTTRDFETQEQAKLYSRLKPESLLFTRMDETFSFGSIYSISNRLRLPVSIFSTGKKLTGDWEQATAERLTASILNIL